MTTFDRILVSVDRNPFGALVRILIGFFFIPAWSLFDEDVDADWTLIIGFISLLVTLRLVPALLRKLLPLSSEVKAVLSERRRIAKRYDSFQWQKLFFLGIGVGCYALTWNGSPWSIALSGVCVACGGIGMVRWYTQVSKVRGSLVHDRVL
ncbi:MAG TPA: hypothetical protein VGF06_17735 [Terriglobales bacterium]|jgi:hypothetical protein